MSKIEISFVIYLIVIFYLLYIFCLWYIFFSILLIIFLLIIKLLVYRVSKMMSWSLFLAVRMKYEQSLMSNKVTIKDVTIHPWTSRRYHYRTSFWTPFVHFFTFHSFFTLIYYAFVWHWVWVFRRVRSRRRRRGTHDTPPLSLRFRTSGGRSRTPSQPTGKGSSWRKTTYWMSKKPLPNLYNNILYKMGQNFFDILYNKRIFDL